LVRQGIRLPAEFAAFGLVAAFERRRKKHWAIEERYAGYEAKQFFPNFPVK